MTKAGKLIEGIFRGATINTPSMLCVADYLDALNWVESIGGLSAAIAKSEANLAAIKQFVDSRPWIDFLAQQPEQVSNTSVCLSLQKSRLPMILAPIAMHQLACEFGVAPQLSKQI